MTKARLGCNEPSKTWLTAISSGSRLKLRTAARYLLGAAFVAAGANHFLHTAFYVSIMPPYLPWHVALVYLSGLAEIGVGVLLLVRRLQRPAAWGAIAVIVAVFPANVQMALHPELYPQFSALALYLRLPVQLVLLAWAYWLTRPDPPPS